MRLSTRHAIRGLLQWVLFPIVCAAVVLIALVGLTRWHTGAAAGGAMGGVTQPATRPVSLRIASFNIHSARDVDGRPTMQKIVELLRGYDFAGLQEVRGDFSGLNQASDIASKIDGIHSLFAPTEWTAFHNDFGNALLAGVPIESWQRVPLPGTQWSHHRNVLIATTRLGEKPVRLLVTHVDRQTDRRAQLDYLWQLFGSLEPPCVIMGDFNTTLADPLLSPFLQGSDNALGDRHAADRIDHIFTRGLRVGEAGVVPNDASDHPLVWAIIEPE